ncbi:MAG: sodium-dependent transporter [Planctomycetota bacterium]|jgi:NSS family neurotransmitter:Na+ symporter
MAELLEERRESWGTRGGFILAAIGSAVGLGNLWGFPYKLYSYGGGAFLIPYIIALLVVGIPIMILEFSIGHYTQRAAPDAFKRGHRRFELVGWWGIILSFVIVAYYPVILAYCVSFLWYSIVGIFTGGELPWAGEGIEVVDNAKRFFNETYLGKVDIKDARFYLGSIRWNIVLPLIITWVAMYFCIFRGVRLVGKIVWLTVPLPWLMLLVLAVRGLTLEGSMQGLAYYLDPVWSELAKPITWRYAFGQVFFSLSLAYGIMITYASFLHRKSDLNNNAAIISIADFATSFVAGLAVFATLGGMAFVTQQGDNPVGVQLVAEKGASLAFVAFPYALAQLPHQAWFSFVFFFALVTLGLDSAFSMTESILASIVDKTGWRRSIVLVVLSVVGFGFGLIFVTRGGFNWLGTIDGFVNGTWGIAFMGLLECVVLGWLWRIGTLRRHANSRSDWQLGRWWDYLIRLVIPILLGTLFFWQLFDDISKESGFLKTPAGFLCGAELEVQSDLDKGIISKELAQELEKNEAPLSRDATVSVEQADSRWLITDKLKKYSVRKEDDKLNIYFLFSVDLEFRSDLDHGLISEELRQKFEENDTPLSQYVTVSFQDAERRWLITDKVNKKKYFVKKDERRLNICPEGQWMLPNCVGLGIVALVPVLAVIFSLVKGRRDVEEPDREEADFSTKGKYGGVVSLLLALIPAACLLVILLNSFIPAVAEGSVGNPVFWSLLMVGIIAMLLSNYVLDKHNTSSSQASWFARWAGILATMDVSAYIAVMLIGLAGGVINSETAVPIRDKLSSVSYIILAVVFLIIIGGLGWCFYRALLAANEDTGIQHPDEIGDKERHAKNSV